MANVPAGSYTLVISYVGTADTSISIEVPEAGLEMGEVVLGGEGAAAAAVEEGLPVIPLLVRGTHELMVRDRTTLDESAGRKCSVTVLPVIRAPSAGTPTERANALMALVHAAYVEELSRADTP